MFDLVDGVGVFGKSLPFRDGSEGKRLAAVEGASDRSSDADELAAQAEDWPTRYHLSPLRANLLKPLQVGPGVRVLEVGAGTGVLSRYLGETGAGVVAVEGSLERAQVVAARCAGMPNVEVLCGPVQEYADGRRFDLVVAVGVLEYAAAEVAVSAVGAPGLLAHLRELTLPEGALELGIENQLGLKYLLGHPEDHTSEPWDGVEGYSDGPGIRTFSPRRLAARLTGAGFPVQRWLFPFPDYKMPTKILDSAAYREPDAPALVDQLVWHPVPPGGEGRALLCDDRAVHRVFLDAGLGMEVANSFLVVAGTTDDCHRRFLSPDTLAWLFGEERLRMWMRRRELVRTHGGRTVRTVSGGGTERRERGWLRQRVPAEEAYVSGQTVEQVAVEACRRHDTEALARVLGDWRRHLGHLETDPEAGGRESHPFLPGSAAHELPATCLDVNLSNFVLSPAGEIHQIDAEWEAMGGVDAELAVARALWYFSLYLVVGGVEKPWAASVTVDELAINLASLGGQRLTEATLASMRRAEAVFQAKVRGVDIETELHSLESLAATSPSSLPVRGTLPYSRLRRHIAGLDRELTLTRVRAEEAEASLAETLKTLESERTAAAGTIQQQDAVLAELKRTNAELTEAVSEVSGRNAELSERMAAAELARRIGELERDLALLGNRRSVRAALSLARIAAPVYRRVRRLPPPGA